MNAWSMICLALRPMPMLLIRCMGLYKFKQGFGGEIYHQLGCWDYPLDEERYQCFAAREMSMQGYYS